MTAYKLCENYKNQIESCELISRRQGEFFQFHASPMFTQSFLVGPLVTYRFF